MLAEARLGKVMPGTVRIFDQSLYIVASPDVPRCGWDGLGVLRFGEDT